MKKLWPAGIALTLLSSCGPAIHSFTATPLTITQDDSVRINYKVRGTPTLVAHMEGEGSNPNKATRVKSLEFTLVAQKGSREARRFIQVNVVPATAGDQITFSTILSGDTLIAAGEKDSLKWGHLFVVHSIASAQGRALIVLHAGRQATLPAGGPPSNAFDGLPYSGQWEIRSLLTAAEKNDHSLAPATLEIKTIIRYQKQTP